MVRKYLIFSIVALTQGILYSQNLVKNPGFEDYYFLPSIYHRQDTFYCKDWFIPNQSSVDFFVKNSIDDNAKVPVNLFGLHPSKSGEAYIGLVPFKWDGAMEQVTGTLTEVLQKDSLYKVTINLRFAGSSCFLCAKKFGIKFSDKKDIYSIHDEPWYDEMFKDKKITADIEFNITELCDSVFWKQYKAIYKAKGAEKYMTLGIFYQDDIDLNSLIAQYRAAWPKGTKQENRFLKRHSNTSILMNNKNYIPNEKLKTKIPYYFIDDVSVELYKHSP